MAADFIGLQMLVTVRDPPARLRGTVSAVEAGSGLTLSNVWWLDTNKWEPRVTIPATNIFEVAEHSSAPPPPAAASPGVFPPSHHHAPIHAATTPPVVAAPPPKKIQPPPNPAFVDPAILAVGKRPTVATLPIRAAAAAAAAPLLETYPHPNTSEKRDPVPAAGVMPATYIESASISQNATPTALVFESSMRSLGIDPAVAGSADEELAPEVIPQQAQGAAAAAASKKKRRQRKSGNGKNGVQEDLEASPQAVPKPPGSATSRGKGWRQTPMLQSTSSFQPFNSLKKNASKGRQVNDNGWASEDVTDVQEAGDFDFEGGLAKFDKHNLFEQMRKDDLIDDADRLVSHNRLQRPKPGTAGGKNFHHSENVLEPPLTILKPNKGVPGKELVNDFWNSEADDGALNGGERLSGRELGSRQGSRRGESKVSATRRSQSRKASGTVTATGLSRVNSGVSSHYRTHSVKGSRPSSRLSANVVTMVDKKKQQLPPSSSAAAATAAAAAAASQRGLYMLPSNRRVETVSALQMLNFENIAHNEVGLTEDMMTENAGRGIAEVTLTALSDPAIKVRHSGTIDPSSGNPPPQTVVVLAGNNKSGIRAVAAARHLGNKGVSVLVCVVGLERGERDLLEDMRQQVRLYKNLGGRVFSKTDFFEHLRKMSIPMLTIDTPRTSSLSSLANPAPIMLIIDALLGLAISFEELRNGDQATVYELIEWANRNEAFVLGLDIPTGIDPSTGKVSVIDGNRLYVKPRYVAAIGAPKRGLLEALMAAEDDDGDTVLAAGGEAALLPDDTVLEWKLFLVDMGLGPAVWKKAGTKLRRGIDYGDRWVVEMRYQGIRVEEEED
ncbi:YjeF-related protein N-terminus-domain-containing protein [Bombardia bombarda]|uniref:Enhancer of mRNA-decapping protein 3 n=1 Tax=Bombardia bombarda TaxID=252184 RepID=A0AA40C1D5_9PEZI|nr:YjeF-related protein N-terminus-domain-containing protein [Bombardia bombarda]